MYTTSEYCSRIILVTVSMPVPLLNLLISLVYIEKHNLYITFCVILLYHTSRLPPDFWLKCDLNKKIF